MNGGGKMYRCEFVSRFDGVGRVMGVWLVV